MFEEGIAAYQGTPMELFRARDRMPYAQTLIAMGRATAAREQLAAARAFFGDPLAKPWRDRIDAVLAQCDAVTAT